MLARYIQYVDAAPTAAFLWSKTRGIVRANPAAWEWTGDLIQGELLEAASAHCAESRDAELHEAAGGRFLLIPLLDAAGYPDFVLGLAGLEMKNIPALLHDLHENLRYFSQTIHLLPQGVLTARPDGSFDYASRRWYQLSGTDPMELDVGSALRRAMGTHRAFFERNWQRGISGGEMFSFEIPVETPHGKRWFELRAAPSYDGAHVRKWIVTLDDVDERVSARAEVAHARARLSAAAEIGLIPLDGSFSYEEVVSRALGAAAGALDAIWSAVFTIDGRDYVCKSPLDAGVSGILVSAAATELSGIATSTERFFAQPSREILRAPLDFGEPGVHQLIVAGAPGAQPFSDFEVDFIRDVASRISIALRNLTANTRNARIARVLQTAMLPVSLPHAPGVSFDVSYVTAESETLIGGDWYDAFELLDGRIAFSIGDVAGHGLDAAVIMGHVREIIRTLAIRGTSPAEVLAETNGVVMAGGYGLITAIVAYFDPATLVLEYASAGHAPPLRVDPDGTVTALDLGDVILGATSRAHFRTQSLRLPSDVALVLYTDGLIEFAHDSAQAEAELHKVLSEWARSGFTDRASELADRVLDGNLATDDVAMLVVRIRRPGVSGYVRERRTPARSAADSRS